MKSVVIILQVLDLLAFLWLLWQIWKGFRKIPEDEVIGEERVKFFTARLNGLIVCFAVQIALFIIQFILSTVS